MPKMKEFGNEKKVKEVPVLDKLSCVKCNKLKRQGEFYKSYDPEVKSGKLPYCKKCLKESCRDENGEIDLELVKNTLKEVDKPFLDDIFRSSLSQSEKDPIGMYIKNISLQQFKFLKWEDSYFGNENTTKTKIKNVKVNDDILEPAKELFGNGFEDIEYKAMWEKYNFLKKNYPGTTNLHVEALRKYVQYAVKEEAAISSSDFKAAKEWGTMAEKAATKAKINISQLSAADLQGGLNSFSEFAFAIEQAKEVVKILPKHRYRPNDAIDFTIWCYINYIRELKGLPLVSYEEVYMFYDRMEAEYIRQYGDPNGIFEGNPTRKNRPNIKKFVLMPKEEDEYAEELN